MQQKFFYRGGSGIPEKDHPQHVLLVSNTQTLYSAETLAQVDRNTQQVAGNLDERMPFKVKYGGTVKSPADAQRVVAETKDPDCIGLAAWFHTFSPGGMHLEAYRSLTVPYIHLITSMNESMPATLDMNYMNTNQTPHGFMEGAHTLVRAGIRQNVVSGHYASDAFLRKFEMYGRVAAAVTTLRGQEILRIGGKMSGVRGTDADIAELQRITGVRVNDDLGPNLIDAEIHKLSKDSLREMAQQWLGRYESVPELGKTGKDHDSLLYAAGQYLVLAELLGTMKATAWTSYFGNLRPMTQLPGMAAQELMRDGWGYGAEGDVMAATLGAAHSIMGQGLHGTSSFSEPYVFDFTNKAVLFAHMIESNPALAAAKPRLEIHPLDIGQSGNPVRTVFDFAPGDCTITSLFMTPSGYNLMTSDAEIIETPPLPNLPTARGLVRYKADLETALECAALAGETHHPTLSTALRMEYLTALANMWGIPHHVVKADTKSEQFAERLELLRAISR
ncbi:MAG TPA: hypothetical protein VJH97_03785 [Candidatus Nanoarchaeia archaeon]|nr:hypothetical protein [Candidatus Nanoarchaeia archaeon]